MVRTNASFTLSLASDGCQQQPANSLNLMWIVISYLYPQHGEHNRTELVCCHGYMELLSEGGEQTYGEPLK